MSDAYGVEATHFSLPQDKKCERERERESKRDRDPFGRHWIHFPFIKCVFPVFSTGTFHMIISVLVRQHALDSKRKSWKNMDKKVSMRYIKFEAEPINPTKCLESDPKGSTRNLKTCLLVEN